MKKFKEFFVGSFFSYLAIELVEEMIEDLIVLGISSLLIKGISTFLVVSLSYGSKLLIKTLIRKHTYKEGKDKLELLKKYFKKAWGNKITGTSAGLGFAGIVWFQNIVPYASHCWWIALITFVVFYNIAIFFGGETLAQIETRLAEATLNKEQQAIIKEAKNKIKAQRKLESQTQAEQERAKAKAEAEQAAKLEKEKADAEHEAKVKEAMAKLLEEEKAKLEAKNKAKE